MKKTILVIYDFGFVNGGAAKIAINTAVELAKIKEKVIYFCAVGPVDKNLKKYVSKVICLEQKDILNNPSKIDAFKNGIWNVKSAQVLEEIIQEIGPENLIIHIHGWSKALSASIFKVIKNYNIVPFLTLHDYFSVCPNGGVFNYKKNSICYHKPSSLSCYCSNCDSRNYIYKLWRDLRQIKQNQWIMNNKDINFIFISKLQQKVISPLLKSKNLFFLNNPIDQVESVRENKIRKKYLYIGRVSKEKGVDLFCEAITSLGLEGIVVGEGPELEGLKKKYLNIDFRGWKNKEEINKIYDEVKFLVFPTKWYEGSPLTVPEALISGVPCLVSDTCAAKDDIKEGVNGYLFKNNDLNRLKEKITLIESLSENSEVFTRKKWNINFQNQENYVKELLKIYDGV